MSKKSKMKIAFEQARLWADPGWHATTIPVYGEAGVAVVLHRTDGQADMYSKTLAICASKSYAEKISKAINDFLDGKPIPGVEPFENTKYMYSRDGQYFGIILDLHCMPCRMEGCTGQRIHVLWSDGTHTYPCSKGCKQIDEHHWRIM